MGFRQHSTFTQSKDVQHIRLFWIHTTHKKDPVLVHTVLKCGSKSHARAMEEPPGTKVIKSFNITTCSTCILYIPQVTSWLCDMIIWSVCSICFVWKIYSNRFCYLLLWYIYMIRVATSKWYLYCVISSAFCNFYFLNLSPGQDICNQRYYTDSEITRHISIICTSI